jgi:hypothetical protein
VKRALLCSAAVVAALALGGCGGDSGDSGGTASVPGFSGGDSGGDSGGSGGSGRESSVDACSLFTEEELTEVLGEHEREQWAGTGESSCQWRNSEYASVSIDIDREGSAPGGTVPAEEAMGDSEEGAGGVTYYSGGYTTFAVGDRACRLQIVVDVTDPMTDRPAIDRFVGLVKERL